MSLLLALFSFTLAHATGNLTEAEGADELQKELNGLSKQAEDTLQKIDQLTQTPAKLAPGSLPAGFTLPSMDPSQPLSELQLRASKLVNDQRFMTAAGELIKSEKRKKLLEIQLCFFVFMLFFKAWRQGATRHWFKRAIVGLACSIITWVGIGYVIPLSVLGEPYAVVTSTLWRVVVMGNKLAP